MTEKRFILVGYVNKGLFIQDNVDDETQYFQGSKASLEKVVDLLNELTEKNKELRLQLNLCSDQRNEFHREARENTNRVGKLKKENEQLKSEIEKLSYANEDLLEEKRIWKQMSDEYTKLSDDNEQLKKELKIYARIATCSNCKYQDYDWFEDGDEFEICKKGNNNQQIEYHICKEWEEF